MTSVIPNIIGPIQAGESFVMLSIVSDMPSVLMLSATKTYYWENDLTKATNPPAFYAQGTAPNLTIRDTINTGGLSLTTSLLTNVLNPGPITVSEDNYALWFPPTVLLSKVPYSLSYQGATGGIAVGVGGGTIPATGIFFVSTTNYFNCAVRPYTVSGAYPNVLNWMCISNFNTNVGTCTGATVINDGWTTRSDCDLGIDYPYCPVDSLCGTASCNGPCSAIYDDCLYSNGNFTCVFDVDKYLKDVPWYENYIVIAFVVGILIFLILLGLVLIRWHNNSRAQAENRIHAMYRERYRRRDDN